MHAIERLRYVARSGESDAGELAAEAAFALAGLSEEPRALVPACRRLLEFHPLCAPLWWVTAHLLVADDVRAAAQRAISELEEDPTADELAAACRSGAEVLASASRTVVRGLCQRPDLSVLLVGRPAVLRTSLRYFPDAPRLPVGVAPSEVETILDATMTVVVEALAAGPTGFLVEPEAAGLCAAADRVGAPLTVVCGVGRILPDELFSALSSRLDGGADGEGPESWAEAPPVHFPPGAATTVVTARGPRTATVAFGRSRCPVPVELTAVAASRPR
jgi:hypothetical protein